MKHYIAKDGYIYTLKDMPLGKEIWTPDDIVEGDLGLMSDEEYEEYKKKNYKSDCPNLL